MGTLRLPYNWEPRQYQKKFWNYWVREDGKHAELIWHRRSGKDDVSLHGTCIKAHRRVANYWHMLPLANQVRKAIWQAVNPSTGKLRIDEAFPPEIRSGQSDHEMLIKLKCGSTWQCLGSDNYSGAIGATPAGIVYSEWSQANPSSRGYLRPILAENNGWQVYITTPRGKNHAHRTYNAAKKSSTSFAELITADDTDVFSPEQLALEKQEYIDTYGSALGNALFQQEYYCSFDAAIIGSIWGAELMALEKEGRFTQVPHDENYPVFTAWDIGRTDATAIWFYQVIGNEVRIIDFYQNTLKDPDHFAGELLGKDVQIDLVGTGIDVTYGQDNDARHRQAYDYQTLWLPHDAKAKTFAAKGKSVEEQLTKVFGASKIRITPSLSKQDQRQAARKLFKQAVFDETTEEGFEAIKQYRFEWDDTKKHFRDNAVHDWTSHPADAIMYLGIAWQAEPTSTPIQPAVKDAYDFEEEYDNDWKTA